MKTNKFKQLVQQEMDRLSNIVYHNDVVPRQAIAYCYENSEQQYKLLLQQPRGQKTPFFVSQLAHMIASI